MCLGLPAKERSEIQQQWMNGEVPVIVATISFGMGVDKANVRCNNEIKISVLNFSSTPSVLGSGDEHY